MPKGMYPIFSQRTTAASTANLQFNNIPQNYTDLVIIASGRGTNTIDITGWALRFNDLTSASQYSNVRYTANGTTVSSDRQTGSFGDYLYTGNSLVGANSGANIFSSLRLVIPNYTDGYIKSAYSDGCGPNTGTCGITMSAGNIVTSSPIVSLTFAFFGTIAQNTLVTLYGIKNSA